MNFERSQLKIGIICGTGLNNADIFKIECAKQVETPYGKPSNDLLIGKIGNVECVLLPRHGKDHTVSPTYINYRANMYALMKEGCTHVIATTACGSLQEEIKQGDIVVLNDFIDRTNKRQTTFYDGGDKSLKGVSHIPMSKPFCDNTRQLLSEACKELDYRHHNKGTTMTIEGPRFSSPAESRYFQSIGCHVVNMTTVPEVCLAKEAGMAYASIALVTDYDCWREGEAVNVEEVMLNMKTLSEKAIKIIACAVSKFEGKDFSSDIKENQDTAQKAIM